MHDGCNARAWIARGRGRRRAGRGAGRNRTSSAAPTRRQDAIPSAPRARDRARPRGTVVVRDAGDVTAARRPQRDPPPHLERRRCCLPPARRARRSATMPAAGARGRRPASSSRRSSAPTGDGSRRRPGPSPGRPAQPRRRCEAGPASGKPDRRARLAAHRRGRVGSPATRSVPALPVGDRGRRHQLSRRPVGRARQRGPRRPWPDAPVALIPDRGADRASFRPRLDAGPVACGERRRPRRRLGGRSSRTRRGPAARRAGGDGATWAPRRICSGAGRSRRVRRRGRRLRAGAAPVRRRRAVAGPRRAAPSCRRQRSATAASATSARTRSRGSLGRGGIAVRNPAAGDGGGPRDRRAVRRLAPRGVPPPGAGRHRGRLREVAERPRRSQGGGAGSAGPAAGTRRSSRSTGRAARRSTRPFERRPPRAPRPLPDGRLRPRRGRPIASRSTSSSRSASSPITFASEVKRRVLDALSRRRCPTGGAASSTPTTSPSGSRSTSAGSTPR